MHFKAFFRFCACLALSGAAVFAQTTSKRRNPTSKFYVAEVEGFAQVNTGEKIEDLTEKSVFDAEGTIVETKPDSSNALVMSNGVGLNFGPDTKLVVKRFLQEPFQPNRTDLESEPSVSQTRTMLSRGAVGICSGKLVAGSSMIYDTPHGSVAILSQNVQKIAIQVADDTTTVSLFEGAITLRGDNMAGGEALQPGQQAVIRKRGVNQPPEITITPIPADQKDLLEDMVNSACQARKKVYFDVAERQNEVDGAFSELDPKILVPDDPTEFGPAVSPARP
jgi:hypothetical protein